MTLKGAASFVARYWDFAATIAASVAAYDTGNHYLGENRRLAFSLGLASMVLGPVIGSITRKGLIPDGYRLTRNLMVGFGALNHMSYLNSSARDETMPVTVNLVTTGVFLVASIYGDYLSRRERRKIREAINRKDERALEGLVRSHFEG